MDTIDDNLRPKGMKNRLFINAVDYVIEQKMVIDQKGVAEKTGITESTLSKIRNDKALVSDKTIRKFIESFQGVFNPLYFKGECTSMLMSDSDDSFGSKKTETNQSVSAEMLISSMRETIEEQRGRIADLQKTIALLEQQLANERTRSASISGIVREKNTLELGMAAEPLESPQPDR